MSWLNRNLANLKKIKFIAAAQWNFFFYIFTILCSTFQFKSILNWLTDSKNGMLKMLNLILHYFWLYRYGSKIVAPNGERKNTRKKDLVDQHIMLTRNHVPVNRYRQMNCERKKSEFNFLINLFWTNFVTLEYVTVL